MKPKNPDNVRAILDKCLTSMLLSRIFMDSQGWVTIQLFSASTTFASNSDFVKRHKRKDQAAEAITTKHILADGLMATSRSSACPLINCGEYFFRGKIHKMINDHVPISTPEPHERTTLKPNYVSCTQGRPGTGKKRAAPQWQLF